MMAKSDGHINFRCSTLLRKKLEEAARRSRVRLSEQIRISLERLYDVEEEHPVWLPDILREVTPSQSQPRRTKTLVS